MHCRALLLRKWISCGTHKSWTIRKTLIFYNFSSQNKYYSWILFFFSLIDIHRRNLIIMESILSVKSESSNFFQSVIIFFFDLPYILKKPSLFFTLLIFLTISFLHIEKMYHKNIVNEFSKLFRKQWDLFYNTNNWHLLFQFK